MKPSTLKRRNSTTVALSAIVKKAHQIRIFKIKTFALWAKGLLTDTQLCKAANEIAQGLYEIELGAGLC